MCTIYDNGLKRLAKDYERIYLETGEAFLNEVVSYQSIRGALVGLYYVLVKGKECLPLEQMEEAEKKALWKEAKRLCGMARTYKVIEVCKAIHAFGTSMQMDRPPEARRFEHIRRDR